MTIEDAEGALAGGAMEHLGCIERALNEAGNAFAHKGSYELDIERRAAELGKHRVRRGGKVGDRIEKRAVEIDGHGLHAQRKFHGCASFSRMAEIVAL